MEQKIRDNTVMLENKIKEIWENLRIKDDLFYDLDVAVKGLPKMEK